jgi:hypothetical protein
MGFFFTLHLGRIMALILICASMAGAASAVVITESPSHVMQGEPITIDIEGLSNSAEFSLLIEATLQVTSGQDFLFETTNFVMPIALDNGQISATTTGAQKATFSAKKGGTTVTVSRTADAGGVFSFSQAQSIPAGTFDYIRLEGTPFPDKNTIVSSIRLNGKKTGPDTSHISFTVNGIDNGLVQLTVLVDGSQAMKQTVTIGEGISSGQTWIAPSSNNGGSSVPSSVPGTTTTLTPAPANTSSIKTFFSADHNASLTVQKGERAGLVTVNPTGVPPTWIMVSDAYTVNPKSIIFSPAATISISIPEHADHGTDSDYFIGGFKNNEWVRLPSTVKNTTITTDIDSAGTYAIMVYKSESSTPVPTTVPSAGTMITGDTPQGGAVRQEIASTTASPLLPLSILPVFGALAIGIGIALVKKK